MRTIQIVLHDLFDHKFALVVDSKSQTEPQQTKLWRFPQSSAAFDFGQYLLSGPKYGDHLPQELLDAIQSILMEEIAKKAKFAASCRSPDFGMHPVVDSLFAVIEHSKENISRLLLGIDVTWFSAREIVDAWTSSSARFSPELVFLAKQLTSSDNTSLQHAFVSCSEQWAQSAASNGTDALIWEYAPNVFAAPILSNTIMPFTQTNLVVITDGATQCLIVDPGASEDGQRQTEAILKCLPSEPKIILTHHHHDHVEGLSTCLQMFPNAEVIAQESTFTRLRPGTLPEGCSINKHVIKAEDQHLMVGSTRVELLFLPGHTDGHMVLWLPESKCLLAGDHIVGYGSAVLDPDGGGNMKQYLESTRRLANLKPNVAIPAHGHPVMVGAIQLLEQYISHRLLREAAILDAWNRGNHTLDSLVDAVYKDTPDALKHAAKRNILLHLEKLSEDNKISMSPDMKSHL